MYRKLLSTPFIFLCLLVFQSALLMGQGTIKFNTGRATDQEDKLLKEHFSAYTLATLETHEVAQLLRSKEHFSELKIEVGQKSFRFNLQARDLRAPNYLLTAWTENGVVHYPRSPNKTFYGYTLKGSYDVRITADTNFFNALIVQEHDELYIEPVLNIIRGAASNQYVIYWGSDNLKKFHVDMCGVDDSQTPIAQHKEDDHDSHPHPSSGRACKEVQIALADDHLMFNDYGSVNAVENHNMAVINNVQTNYDNEFSDNLQFSVVQIYVATTAGNDPWTNSLDPGELLDDFTNWGPTGFSNTHDVGSLWTARNFNGPTIGLAWLNAICTSFRYNVLEDFSNNANFLRVLQAHELGHNFSAGHDASGSNTIMAPSVNNTNLWSTASVNAVNNFVPTRWCLAGCGAPQPPVADFFGVPTEGCAPLVVNFDDESLNNPTGWNWTFPGGSPASSTSQNPTVTYNSPGTYNVTLSVNNSQGANAITKLNYITVGQAPFADFDYQIDQLTVDFQNQSAYATTYLWMFGDGTTSTQVNPLHTYAQDGTYTVTLKATNSCGMDIYSRVITITTLPQAGFTANPTTGCDPFQVEFINLSSPNAQYFSWTFPGGSPPSSPNYEPTIVYETPGTYNVSLTVFNEAGDNTYTAFSYITVLPMPMAEFSYVPNGLEVTFNSNGSVGNSYFWNFGDGNATTAINPVHTYAATGTYVVSLTVTNECGTETLQLNVSVTGAPVAGIGSNTQYGCAPLVVQFMNQSVGSPTSFNWVFEGGVPASSSMPNPLVTYNTPGIYDVQLTVMNGAGTDVLLLSDYIEVEFPTTSGFGSAINGSQATFTNQSSHATGYAWTFGDGNVSEDIDPVHTYASDGVYTVTLISFGICGDDTSTAQINIQTPPQAAFSFQQSGDCAPVVVIFDNESSPNATSFEWSFPGGSPTTSTQSNPTVTYSNAGAYSVTLIAYSSGGSDTTTWSNFMTIGAVPNAAFIYNSTAKTITLNNQSTNADTYFWDFGDGQTSNEQHPVHVYNDYGFYTLILISSNICGSDTMEVILELSTKPKASYSYSAHSGCGPFEVQFTDQSTNNPTSWEWTFDGGNPATSDQENPTVVYSIPGVYSVTLRVENGSGSDVLVLNDLIKVGGVPDPTFNHIQNANTVSLAYPGIDYDSLRWSFGDGRTDNSLNPTVTYPISGVYQITLIIYNPCGSYTSSIWVTINVTSTNNPKENEAGWQIRPNPFQHVLTIYGQPVVEGRAEIILMDVHGQLLYKEDWQYPSNTAIKEILADQFAQGVILVLIQDKDSRVILKAVHQ